MAAIAALTAVAPAGAVTITEFTPLGGEAGTHGPRYIKGGPDGNIWYADGGSDGQIVRMNTHGEVSGTFGAPGEGSG
jgi:streptogramin lyase